VSPIEAFISGCLQGITEFLPISSSGHLVILHSLFGINRPRVDFDILLHIATIFSVIIFFRRDILKIFTNQRDMILAILIGSIPTALIGLSLKGEFEMLFAKPRIVGFMFFITAAILILAALKEKFIIRIQENTSSVKTGMKTDNLLRERLENKNSNRTPSFIKAFLIGISQGVAIVPGISRSGATISSGILLGIESKEAVRFSFLLSIPAILGASFLKVRGLAGLGNIHIIDASVGFLSAFIFGIISLRILVRMVLKGKLHLFALYCILIGMFAVFRF